jgi:hypothetical protein
MHNNGRHHSVVLFISHDDLHPLHQPPYDTRISNSYSNVTLPLLLFFCFFSGSCQAKFTLKKYAEKKKHVVGRGFFIFIFYLLFMTKKFKYSYIYIYVCMYVLTNKIINVIHIMSINIVTCIYYIELKLNNMNFLHIFWLFRVGINLS